MTHLLRILQNPLTKYETDQKKKYKRYVQIQKSESKIWTRSEKDIYGDLYERLRSLRRSARKSAKDKRERHPTDKNQELIVLEPEQSTENQIGGLNRRLSSKRHRAPLPPPSQPADEIDGEFGSNDSLPENSSHKVKEKRRKSRDTPININVQDRSNVTTNKKTFSYNEQSDFLDQLDRDLKMLNQGRVENVVENVNGNMDNKIIESSLENRDTKFVNKIPETNEDLKNDSEERNVQKKEQETENDLITPSDIEHETKHTNQNDVHDQFPNTRNIFEEAIKINDYVKVDPSVKVDVRPNFLNEEETTRASFDAEKEYPVHRFERRDSTATNESEEFYDCDEYQDKEMSVNFTNYYIQQFSNERVNDGTDTTDSEATILDSIEDKDTQTSLKSILKKPQTGQFQEDAYPNQILSDGDITDDEFCGYLMLEDITEEDENQESSTEGKDNTKKVRFEPKLQLTKYNYNLQTDTASIETSKPSPEDLHTSFKLFEDILSKRNKTAPEKHVTTSESNLPNLHGENRNGVAIISREYHGTATIATVEQTIEENPENSQNLAQLDESEDEIEARHTSPGFVARDYVNVQDPPGILSATTIPRYNSLSDLSETESEKIANRTSPFVEPSRDFSSGHDISENQVNLNRNDENYGEGREGIKQFGEQLRSKNNADEVENLGNQIELFDEDIIIQDIYILEPPDNFHESESILKHKVNTIPRHNSLSDFSETECGKIVNRRSSLIESSGDSYTFGGTSENIANMNLNEENYEDNRRVIQQFDDEPGSKDHGDKIQKLGHQFEPINVDIVNQDKYIVELPGNVHNNDRILNNNVNTNDTEEGERNENVISRFENEIETNVSDEYRYEVPHLENEIEANVSDEYRYEVPHLEKQTEIFGRHNLNYDSFIPKPPTNFNDKNGNFWTEANFVTLEDQRGNFEHNGKYGSNFGPENKVKITNDYEDKSQNLNVKTETDYDNTTNSSLSFIEPPDNFQDDKILSENPVKFEEQEENHEQCMDVISNVANNPMEMAHEFAGSKDRPQNMNIQSKTEDLGNGIENDFHLQMDENKMLKYQNIERPDQHYDERKHVEELENGMKQQESENNEVDEGVILKQVLESKLIKCDPDFSKGSEGDEESPSKNIMDDSDLKQLNNTINNKLSELPLSTNEGYEKESDISEVNEVVKATQLLENEIVDLNFDTNHNTDFTFHREEDEVHSSEGITNYSPKTKSKLFLLPPTVLSSTNKMYEPVFSNAHDVHSPRLMSTVHSPSNNFHGKNESVLNNINVFDFNSKIHHNTREDDEEKMEIHFIEKPTMREEQHNEENEETLVEDANYENLEKDAKQQVYDKSMNTNKYYDDSNKNGEIPKMFNELNNRLNVKPIILPKTSLATPITYQRVFTPEVTTSTFDFLKITGETKECMSHHEGEQEDDKLKKNDISVMNSCEASQGDENPTTLTVQNENSDMERNLKEGDKSFPTNEGLLRISSPRTNNDDENSMPSTSNVNPDNEQHHKEDQIKESVFRSVYRTLSDASRKRQEDRLKREKVEIEKEVVETSRLTLDEINERLLDVKSSENIHDQMMIIQKLNDDINQRIDDLKGKNDSESISMLQLLFRVLRTLSAIDCRSDSHLKNLQVELRQDIQNNITLISSNY